MDIKEFNKQLDGYKLQLESANRLQTEIDSREEELIEVIKQEMKERGINAIQIDLYGEIGESVDIDDWNLMYLYEDEECREVAPTVYIDNHDNLQFVSNFNNAGFSETLITPYCENPISPAITFSVGTLNLNAADPCNNYNDYYPGEGIVTGECDPYQNGVVHLAAVFGKCMEIYDKEVSRKA